MSNKLLAGVGVVVVIVVAWFLMKGGDSANGPEGADTKQEESGQAKSLKQLAESGKPVSCTYKDTSTGFESEGKVFVANGKTRTDYSATINGQKTGGHMIMADGFVYTWSDGVTQGVKMAISADQQAATGAETQQALDTSKALNYDCDNWSNDDSVFKLPSGVNFMELNVGGGVGTSVAPNSGAQSDDSICATCDSVPADSRAQCRQALGCK